MSTSEKIKFGETSIFLLTQQTTCATNKLHLSKQRTQLDLIQKICRRNNNNAIYYIKPTEQNKNDKKRDSFRLVGSVKVIGPKACWILYKSQLTFIY